MSNTKSKTKAMGLKSALVIDDKVLVTSFGKGNAAVPEKEITGENVKNIEEHFLLAVDMKKGAKFKIEKNEYTVKTECNNPRYVTQSDLLHAKDKIEMYVFGKTFPNDNIHIQIAYNILDIKKILSLYANNIIFSLNNLRHKEETDIGRNGKIENEQDFIGMLYTGNTYATLEENCSKCKFKENCNSNLIRKKDNDICQSFKKFRNYFKEIEPYLSYFSEAFYEDIPDRNSKKDAKAKRRDQKAIYNIIRTLSLVRQSCFHDQKSTRNAIFNIKDNEIKEMLNKLYRAKVYDVNNGFINNNGKNISILADIYNKKTDAEKAELVADFYNYIIFKENKNLGFNLKTVREMLVVDESFSNINDSVRHKTYILMDYILYKYYTENQDVVKEFVEELRRNLDDEKGKNDIYSKYVDEIKPKVKNKIIQLMTKMDVRKIGKEKEMHIKREWIKNVQLKSSKNYFPKVIWLMTLFLDGKEINELLSAMINKFENIQSFIKILEYKNLDNSFENYDYKMFEKSGKIAAELRAVKSFSRMQGEIANPTIPEIHADAARILGLKANYTDEELIEYIKDLYHTEENKSKEPSDRDNKMRNFIINNVIKSNRFLYLVRYNNPKRSRKLASNRELIKFVLSRIPEEQINRYYFSVNVGIDGKTNTIDEVAKINTDIKINNLTNIIVDMKFESIENQKKERYKAAIGLYLTVLYLITKNLVKINARYTIAISCLERDTQFFGIDIRDISKTDKRPRQPYTTLTYNFVGTYVNDKGGHIKKSMQYIVNNDRFYREYRDMIAHLEAITFAYKYVKANDNVGENICVNGITSYYQLYHTILQIRLSERLRENPQKKLLKELEEKAKAETEKMKTPNKQEEQKKEYTGIWYRLYKAVKQGSYSKNLVCILNTPFAYNVARYKNLSLEYLFDFDKDGDVPSDNNTTNKK